MDEVDPRISESIWSTTKRNQDADLTIEYFQEQATYVSVGGVVDPV